MICGSEHSCKSQIALFLASKIGLLLILLMKRQLSFQPAPISPWEVPHQQTSPHRKTCKTPPKRLTISYSPHSKTSKTKPEIMRRTAAKMATIDICSIEARQNLNKKQIGRCLTPNINKKALSERFARKQSPELGHKGSLMNLQTWKQESIRILSKKGKDLHFKYGKSNSSKTNMKFHPGNGTNHPKKQQDFKLVSLYLADSDLTKTTSIHRQPVIENPNMTRFKLLQSQKRAVS